MEIALPCYPAAPGDVALTCACVPIDSLERRYGHTLTVEADLSALNAHLGVLKKGFQVRAGHTGG